MVKLHGQCNAPGEVIGVTLKTQRRVRRKVRCKTSDSGVEKQHEWSGSTL